MKINGLLIIICAAIAGLMAFGFYAANKEEVYRILLTAGSGFTLFLTLVGTVALSSQNRGSIVNIRVVSILFFLAFLIVHILFSIFGVSLTPYIVITGILFLLYVLLSYLIIQALKQKN